ncbi:MAG: SLC13 family permease, partial [Candidatus Thermoplasmatota archaeon]|nr:SLC13 family permease [Candidatus Thermoplasmatota archaeon]
MDLRRMAKLALPILLLLIVLMLPRPEGLTYEGQAMFAVLAFAASIFLLQPIPLGLAGIVVLVLPLILGATSAEDTFRSFGNSAVFFLIGAFIIAATVERTTLHKRVSLHFLKIAGRSPKLLVLGTMLSGATLSFIMPEHGVIVLIVPVLMYLLIGMGLVPLKSNLGKAVMIGAAFGCTIGSLGTPLGGARNPLTIGFLRTQGIDVAFFRWMALSFPIVLLSLFGVWVVLIVLFPSEIKDLSKGRKLIENEVNDLPPVQWSSLKIIIALVGIILMFILLPQYFNIDISIIALIGGVLIF